MGGLSFGSIYGGGGPSGSPLPNVLNEDADYTNPKANPVIVVVALIGILVAIRLLFEMAD